MSATSRLAGRPGAGEAPEVRLVRAAPGEDDAGLRARVRSLRPSGAGQTVSRSYRFPFALIAWHTGPVGVDLERLEDCPPGFAASICTPAERAARPAPTDPEAIVLWSGKEALAKALGDALRYDPRRLESPWSWPDGRCGPWRARRLTVPDGLAGWLCWQAPGVRRRPA